jgi:hypothetical protein
MKDKTIYLGDSVYATANGRCIELNVDNPEDPGYTVYLEDWVMKNLIEFYNEMIEEYNL